MSRYVSFPGNKLMAKVFNLPCVSTLQKMVSGKLGGKKALFFHKESGSISTEVIVIFDEQLYFVMNNLKVCVHELDFNVRGAVSDNYSNNVSAYSKLFSQYGNDLNYISHSIVSKYICSTTAFI